MPWIDTKKSSTKQKFYPKPLDWIELWYNYTTKGKGHPFTLEGHGTRPKKSFFNHGYSSIYCILVYRYTQILSMRKKPHGNWPYTEKMKSMHAMLPRVWWKKIQQKIFLKFPHFYLSNEEILGRKNLKRYLHIIFNFSHSGFSSLGRL